MFVIESFESAQERGATILAELAGGIDDFAAIGIAGARVTLMAVGIRPKLFTFTGEVVLALQTHALAVALANLLRMREALVIFG